MNRRIAFLFPGQGAQTVGMGRLLYEGGSGEVRAVFDQACEALGYDLRRIMFEGPEEILLQTVHTQPAILVHSVAMAVALGEAGVRPDFAAGHSLGEYSALVVGGALSLADALNVVQVRAESMQAAGEARPGAMSAVMGLGSEEVRAACQRAAKTGIVQPANYNAPDQTVISGQRAAVEAAGAACREAGAKRVIPLKVHGAFHSPLMESAVEPVRQALRQVTVGSSAIPVVSNVTARPAVRPEEIRELLGLQIVYPVRWAESMQELDRMGTTRWVESGPGSVLRGLLKRSVPGAVASGAGEPEEIAAVVEAVSS
jgi:[acyl-carrier-protein] S-malonyltransferase